MSIFGINDRNVKLTREDLGSALGETLQPLCNDMFFFTVKHIGNMKDVRAEWVYDEFFGAWNLVIGKKDHSLYTVFGQADGFVCHFFYHNVMEAQKAGHEAWIKVTDEASLKTAEAAIEYVCRD